MTTTMTTTEVNVPTIRFIGGRTVKPPAKPPPPKRKPRQAAKPRSQPTPAPEPPEPVEANHDAPEPLFRLSSQSSYVRLDPESDSLFVASRYCSCPNPALLRDTDSGRWTELLPEPRCFLCGKELGDVPTR